MKKIFFLFAFIMLMASGMLKAGNSDEFVAHGKPTLRLFGNFHTGLTAADGNRIFEIERAYLGYQYQMSPNWMAEIKVDIGSPENESVYALVKRYAYFRNAYIKYEVDRFDVSFGIVSMTHVNVQKNFWGYRYVLRSFADEYKFGKTVDLGVIASYHVANWFSFDLSMVNGEGYSQLQSDNYFEYCAGATFTWQKKLIGRLYANYGPSDEKTKMVYAAFLGYHITPKWSAGAEYNLLNNYKYLENRNQSGYSVYSTYQINKRWKVFGRYDCLSSNILEGGNVPWNLVSDGTAAIAGAELKMNSNLKFSVNYRDWYPRAANMGNRAYIYLNVEFKL